MDSSALNNFLSTFLSNCRGICIFSNLDVNLSFPFADFQVSSLSDTFVVPRKAEL